MDRALNPKEEKQSIYELYRACRLCGAGAGYKMPIIQNVVDLDGDGVELRQKIIECVQIEVNHTDRMPPLICELCVDKVNDFYQFLDMCRQTNKRTRLRLGLPLKTRPQGSPDSDNCILGVIEPVYQDDSDGEPLGQKSKRTRIKKEPPEPKDAKIKSENVRPSPKPRGSRESRESSVSSEEPRFREPWRRTRPPTPGPKRSTRQRSEVSPETEGSSQTSSLKRLREKSTKVDTPAPVKKTKLAPEPMKSRPGPKSSKIPREARPPSPTPSPPPTRSSKPSSRKDRKRSPTPPKPSPTKTSKTKITSKTNSRISSLRASSVSTKTAKDDSTSAVNTHSKATLKSTPPKTAPIKTAPIKTAPIKSAPTKTAPVKTAPTKVDVFICNICNTETKNQKSLTSHCAHKHFVSVISPKYACNACELWFHTVDEAARHHRDHRDQNIPYKCTRCYGYFKLHQSYEDHFGEDLCLSSYEVPDVKCEECWRTFPTSKLMEDHKCPGEDGRAGGKCGKCGRNYALLKNLTKHESSCNYRKKGELIVDPEVRARLLQMTVRIARCDALLAGKRVNATTVSHRYGLDSKCTYPYLPSNVKTEPSSKLNHMVSINDEIKEEFCTNTESWYSDEDSNSSQKTVDSLSNMSLKILSRKCSIKGPKRKVKSEDSMTDSEISKKIDSIIVTLGNEDSLTCNYDSDSILDKKYTKDSDTDKLKGDIDKKLDELKDDSQTSFDSDSILGKNNSEVAINYELATNNDTKESESIERSIESNQGTQTDTNCSEINNEGDIKDCKGSSQNLNDSLKENDSNKRLVQNNIETDVKERAIASEDNTSIVDIKDNVSLEKNESVDGIHKESDIIDSTNKHDTYYDIDVRDDFDKRSPNNEDLSRIDEITNKILAAESHDLDANINNEKPTDTVNGLNRADKEDAKDSNDGKVMAELDAQIAGSNVEKKPFSIKDLLKPDDLKSLDLDSISDDEFSFDV